MGAFHSPESLGSAKRRNSALPRSPPLMTIALVNNMPDAALVPTERQFRRLILQGPDAPVTLRIFHLPNMPRSEAGKAYCQAHYEPADHLFAARFDGLVVTGCEPRARSLEGEPFWTDFRRLVDWASENTIAAIWSCLAAHAALLHLDGIERQRLPQKLHGIFACSRAGDHALLTGLPDPVAVPHSRLNSILEADLQRCGYGLLTRAEATGPDAFFKQTSSLFVFLQGHPEYDADSLNREFKRDIARFLGGERDTFPELPQGVFDAKHCAEIEAFARAAVTHRMPDLLDAAAAILATVPALSAQWQKAAGLFYRNWLTLIANVKFGTEKPQVSPGSHHG